MPYRRLPKTDAARLKALKTLLGNNNIYVVRNRFLDWKTINQAQTMHDKLLTAYEQYKISAKAQSRNGVKYAKLLRNARLYVSHFLQVLLMSFERGEIKKTHKELYGLKDEDTKLPNMQTIQGLIKWGEKVIKGEQTRIKAGGRPIYNPTIGMVSTHLSIFKEFYNQQKNAEKRTKQALRTLQLLRPEVDEVLLDIWNQVEAHFSHEPIIMRINACKEYGLIYYYRKNEKKD